MFLPVYGRVQTIPPWSVSMATTSASSTFLLLGKVSFEPSFGRNCVGACFAKACGVYIGLLSFPYLSVAVIA